MPPPPPGKKVGSDARGVSAPAQCRLPQDSAGHAGHVSAGYAGAAGHDGHRKSGQTVRDAQAATPTVATSTKRKKAATQTPPINVIGHARAGTDALNL